MPRASGAYANSGPGTAQDSGPEDSRPSDDREMSVVPAKKKETDTVAKQVESPPDARLGEAGETRTRSANGHSRRRVAKNGHTRHVSHGHRHSRKRTERRESHTASPLERPFRAAYRLSREAKEAASPAQEPAKNGVLLATKEAPSLTPDIVTNAVSLEIKAPPAAAQATVVAEPTGPAQGMAINGVSLQVRAPASPAAKRERPVPAEVPLPSRSLSAVSPPTVPGLDAAIPGDSSANAKPTSMPAQPDSKPATPAAKPFRPLLEVDRFLWSDECDRFARAVGGQLEGLAEQIADEARLGRQIVGVASCRRGDGCTTLTLSLAPRLVAMGLKVLLVDSDFHNPTLGHRLGLLPESGWEEVLAGHLPLEEVIIESIHDRLALLPLKSPSPGRSYDLGGNPQPRVSLELAAQHYELVLVDVGRFHRHDSKNSNLPQPDGRWLQSLVLLHNVRSTPDEDLTRNRQRIRAAGIREMGIVENFA